MDRYAHIDMTPPKAARAAAERFVAAQAEGAAVHSVVGHHARAIASGRPVTAATVRYMAGAPAAPFAPDAGSGDAVGGEAGNAWARRVSADLDAADRAATAGAGPHSSVAIVLPVDGATADFIALPTGLPASEMHLTLAFFGKADAFTDADRARLSEVIEAWARETPALPATFSGLGRFVAGEGEPDPVHLTVDAPGLSAAREDLVRRVRAAGYEVRSNHGFDPHVTLTYLPAPAPTPTLPFTVPLALGLDRVALWWGDDRSFAPALTGTADPTTLDARTALHGEGVAILFDAGEEPEVGHTTWNQIARVGAFLGHPQGPVVFTTQVFDEVIQNFRATKNGEVPGDYEHTSERLPARAATDGVPAPFWIKDVAKRANGAELWAAFEWVDPQAVGYVRSKRYKYLSPAIIFGAKSRETGKPIGARLTSCALTNHPFIDGLAPVTASTRADGDVTAFSPAPDALHAPGFGPRAPAPRPKDPHAMTVQKKPAPAAPAAPVTDPAAIAPPVVEAPPAPVAAPALETATAAPVEAAPAAVATETPAAAPMSAAFVRRCADMMGMAEVPADHEAAENAVYAQLEQMMAKLRQIQETEAAAEMARAAAMADRVVAADLAPATAKDALTTMCLSSRAVFDALYPEARIAAAETAIAAAKAPPAPAAPKSALPVTMTGRVDPDAATVLLSRIGAAEGTTGDAAPAPNTAADAFARVQARVVEIRSARPEVSVFAAREMAERELFDAARAQGAAVVTAPAKPATDAPAPTPKTDAAPAA